LGQLDRMKVAVTGKDQSSLGKSISECSRLRDIPIGMLAWTDEVLPAVESALGTGVYQLILPWCLSGPASVLRDEERYTLLWIRAGVLRETTSTSGSLLKQMRFVGESGT
jgi:hypothetical protein